MRQKASFERVYQEGSDWVTLELIHVHLTSRQLKVKSKANKIAGLQLADLIAHPSFKIAPARHNAEVMPQNFSGQIGEILLVLKYDRSPSVKNLGMVDKVASLKKEAPRRASDGIQAIHLQVTG